MDKEIPRDNKFIRDKQGILLFEGLVYMPISKWTDIIQQYHNTQNVGHRGVKDTIKKILRNY